ncbi:MAG: hypothetical protein PHO08_20115 [Methylococcales bacterium]|nr:hypothetical protein [Methylococcales bacterium]MDD5632093.1 hypothetical protein [Methylococcales bacterium]
MNDTGHGGITRDALVLSITIDGETLKFTDKAKEEIKDANFEVDHHQLTASFHFDDESLNEGMTRINTLKEQVIQEAKAGNGKSARKSLGGALHTIQDFFAHSNQADQGLVIPNFGVDILNALPSNVATCDGSILNPGSTLLPSAGLTTGYFKIPLCNPPAGKCKNGLGICPGIAKDSDSHPLHNAAYSNAVTASNVYIMSILDDARMTSDPKAVKKLMDIRPMISAVIDDTGSMGGVISGVSAAVSGIVNSVKGTQDEPDKYLLERFGDPNVGTPSSFTDSGSFLSAVNSIVPSGGGDCPELSMEGTYNAVVAAENDSRLFTYTDASAKDAGKLSAVANLATKKRIQLTTALSGNCSPYDPTYFELARRTGGQVFITTRTESGTTLANLMRPLVRNDVHLILQASLNLTGNQVNLSAPIDDTVKQAIFSVGMITKGTIALRRPNGALVQGTDTGITITDTIGSKTIEVNAPEPGDWKIELTGTGTTLVTAIAATPSFLHKFEFVNMAGRTEHQGLFPIDGNPIAGKTQMVRAVMFGMVNIGEFSFRRPDGTVISRFSLASNNPLGATDDDFVGEVVPPIEPFLVYVSGTTPGGQPFQRAVPGQLIASNVEVRSASDLTSVPAGRTTAVAFSITNYGVPAFFTLTAIDSLKFLTTAAPSPIKLDTDESLTVTVNVSPPLTTVPATEFAVTLTATAGTDDTSNSASILLAVAPSNRDPICSAASASPDIIHRVNHKMVPVAIVGVTDADNDPVQIRIVAITQDEPVTGKGSGNTSFDAIGVGTSSAQVRAERSGLGDGRVYRIAFDAVDGKGGQCSGSVKVEVPHDNRISAPDSGSGINSLGIK